MAKDLNDCKFTGRIGRDIELKYMPNGDAVANFSIACNDDYKNKAGELIKRTEWINLVSFGRQAEIISQYLGKGSKILVSTKQTTRKWQDKNGQDRYTTENKIIDFQMFGPRTDAHGGQGGVPDSVGGVPGSHRGADGSHPSPKAATNNQPMDGFDDDQEIPF